MPGTSLALDGPAYWTMRKLSELWAFFHFTAKGPMDCIAVERCDSHAKGVTFALAGARTALSAGAGKAISKLAVFFKIALPSPLDSQICHGTAGAKSTFVGSLPTSS